MSRFPPHTTPRHRTFPCADPAITTQPPIAHARAHVTSTDRARAASTPRHNWTPYKEYGRTFTPNYAVGQITLKQDSFAEVTDNSTVTLTFHFWSGETLTYTLTRTGTTVTGTTT